MTGKLLEVNNVYFTYGGKEHTLDDVSFDIADGEIVGIAGPNGAGKTTLLKLIVGLLKPTRGKITLTRSTASGIGGLNRVSYLPQNVQRTDPNFPATVREVVSTGLYAKIGILGRLSASDEEAIMAAIRNVDMERFSEAQITKLSGGQLQRVLIARSLVSNPSLLIMDEPTAAVDLAGEEDFFNLIKHVNSVYGVAVLLVSHDVYSLLAHTDRLIFINKKVLYDADPRNLSNARLLKMLFSHKHSRPLIARIEKAEREKLR
jgi:zinc transport system ATP-binding protein